MIEFREAAALLVITGFVFGAMGFAFGYWLCDRDTDEAISKQGLHREWVQGHYKYSLTKKDPQ